MNDIFLVVTTILKASPEVIAAAGKAAEKLNAPFILRGTNSLEDIKKNCRTDVILVMTKDSPVVYTAGGKFFFHLSMAELRIKNIINGKDDHMIKAMGLVPGMSVLDCTLGLGTDCIVTSYVAGETARIVGLESSPVISLITGLGLKNFTFPKDELNITDSLRRIEVENTSYIDYLTALPDKSFDIVYFDPMFRQPINKSSNFKPLRTLTDNSPIGLQAVKEATRVASSRVVMKEANGGSQVERLGFSNIYGGKYSSVKYGVIDLSCRPELGGLMWNG